MFKFSYENWMFRKLQLLATLRSGLQIVWFGQVGVRNKVYFIQQVYKVRQSSGLIVTSGYSLYRLLRF